MGALSQSFVDSLIAQFGVRRPLCEDWDDLDAYWRSIRRDCEIMMARAVAAACRGIADHHRPEGVR